MQIVIAWVNMDGVELTGRYLDRYMTEQEIRRVPKAHACMWLNDGDESDVKKAEDYAKADGRTIYTFSGEKNPLDAAKKLALTAFAGAVR